MVLRPRDDDAVDQYSGDLHLTRTQAAALRDALHLHDHQAIGVVHRGSHREGLQCQRLALHGDVPLGIRGGAPQEGHIELERLVEQVLHGVEGDQLDAVVGRPLVDLPAAMPRVDEGPQPHPGQQAGLARGNVPEQLRDGALRQIVRLDLVLQGHLPQLGRQGPMATHGPLEQALVAQPVQPATLPVPLGDGKHEREIAGGAGLQETLLQRQRQLLGETLTHEPFDHDRVAVPYQPHRLGGRDDLVPHRRAG